MEKTLSTQTALKTAFKEEVFLVIADYSFLCFSRTKFGDYFLWANYVRKCLEANSIGPIGKQIDMIVEESNHFFGFSEEELTEYVLEFFLLGKFNDTHEIIRLVRQIYGSYVCLKKQ